MQPVLLYVITAVIFLGIDAVMLNKVMKPLFENHLGDWLQMPALKNGTPTSALISGGIIGAMAYGTYEFTNYATLKLWAPQMVATDVIWGTVLTGFSAWIGVVIVRAIP